MGSSKPFGLRKIKLASIDLSQIASLSDAQTLGFKEKVTSGEMKGNDRISAVVSFTEAVEWDIENGGISFEAYSIITGRPVITAGVTPNQTVSITGRGGDIFPYFLIFGQSVSDKRDDLHCKLFKCKATSFEGKFGEGKFWVSKFKGLAVPDEDNDDKIFEFVENETATPIVVA